MNIKGDESANPRAIGEFYETVGTFLCVSNNSEDQTR